MTNDICHRKAHNIWIGKYMKLFLEMTNRSKVCPRTGHEGPEGELEV
jgi:hypothetical protein